MKNQCRGPGRPAGEPTVVVRLPVLIAELAKRFARRPVRAGDINEFLDVQVRVARSVPLVGAKVPAGFPSPADDYLDRALERQGKKTRSKPRRKTFTYRYNMRTESDTIAVRAGHAR
jgi:hypothetical protein